MIHNARKRLPFLATGLAVAIGFMSSAQGEDKSPLTPNDKTTTSTSSTSKQVTMTGKVVNLHQFMTGQSSSSSSNDRSDRSDRSDPSSGIKPTDRSNPSDSTKPADRNNPSDNSKPTDRTPGTTSNDRNDATANKQRQSGNMSNEIMGLETSTGLVLICFQDAPSTLATPRDDDSSATRPGNPVLPNQPRTPKLSTSPNDPGDSASDHSRHQDSSHWQGKQVEVTGSIYEKNGIKFLVVSKVAAAGASTTTEPKTTPRP